MTARSVRLLPQPDSPTSPIERAGLHRQRDAVDGAEALAVPRDLDDEVVDLESGVGSFGTQHVGQPVAEQ